MKINGTNRIGNVNEYKKSLESRTANTAGKKDKAKDQVEISATAKELLGSQGTEQAKERIEQLKNSVAAGTYHVEAKKIAEKLLPFIEN
nr:flagellar biosynthesis anti-sigma factor FlgM [Paenibacillus hamazuiensis]